MEQTHEMVARLFEQRFRTYGDVLHRAQDVVQIKGAESDGAKRSSNNDDFVRASRALLDELDRAMLLATDPVRTALKDFYRKSFIAFRPTTVDTSNPFREVAGRIVASQDYAVIKEQLRELMSSEMRGLPSVDRESPK